MGRRSQHKPDELRDLIINAAYRIVADNGVALLSAREIARVIGYAPGTLYNMYENLDEILLRVEVRMLEQLDAQLAHDMKGTSGAEAVRRFAAGYVRFAHKQPRLWSLLTEHSLPPGTVPPAWYREAIETPIARLEKPVATVLRSTDTKAVRQAARGLWFTIQSMTSMSVSAKLAWSNDDAAGSQIIEVADAYLAYLKQLTVRPAKRLAEAHGLKEATAASR